MRVLLLAALLAGCAAPAAKPPPPLVMKCPTVPPLRPEHAPDPPRPAGGGELTLTPGHWDWEDGDYSWIAPAWVPRANGRIWQDGAWTPSGIACAWNPGHLVF